MKNEFSKKIVIVLLLVSLLLPGSFLIQPREANATIPVGDWPGIVRSIFEFVSEGLKEELQNTLQAIGWAVAKALVAQITQQTIDWINSGGEGGNPLYVQNLDAYMAFICTESFNSFMEELENEEEMEPEAKRIIARTILASRPCDGERSVTDARTIASEVLDDYYQDFRRGGWRIWRQQVTNPSNTIYGQYAQSRAELRSRLQRQARNEREELQWGSGFLSSKHCDEEGNCQTATPGALIESRIETALNSDIQQLNLADSIDEVVNAALRRIVEEVFTAGQGLLETDVSRTGADDVDTDETDPELLARAQDSLLRMIDLYIDNETAYREVKEESLEKLDEAEEKLSQLGPERADFRQEAQQEIDEKRDSINEDLGIGQEEDPIDAVIADLNDFKNTVEEATTPQEVNGTAKEFNDYKNDTHTNDMGNAQEELFEIEELIREIEGDEEQSDGDFDEEDLTG